MRIEHLAFNVKDPVAMAAWYGENLGVEVVREGPPPANARFIADATGNVILEIYNNPPDAVPDYGAMDPLLFHVAFAVDDLVSVRDELAASGATFVEEFSSPEGDAFVMLRDPWGLALQLVKRARPMLCT